MRVVKSLIGALIGTCIAGTVSVAKPVHDYFPKGHVFSAQTQTPEDYLGFEIGDWHITPAALTGYMRTLAENNKRVSIEKIGYSHERRELSHVYISSPENIANLDKILKKHQEAQSADDDVLVVNLSYSIHGNEASGSNAAPLVAYYLAASKDEDVKAFLKNTVVIIDPTLNPDGLARFASWANFNKGKTENFDPANRDHYEVWPSGRTNHYGFDLNRDWIFTVHPESKARIKAYQKWRPHLLGDFHEMGSGDSSYFFQPGHPKRTHPLTLKENQKITGNIAKFHAEALDAKAQPYFAEEQFDDFYYGKGSTYPDGTGSIGILYEQASVRGHAIDMNGVNMRFEDAIGNHVATSLSTLKGAHANRDDLMEYRFTYIKTHEDKLSSDKIKAYVFGDDNDPARAGKFLKILKRHNIPVYPLSKDIAANGMDFTKDHAFVVKVNAQQYGLIHSLFEVRTSFEDNVFYDVSQWNLPLALNLPFAPLSSLRAVNDTPVTTFEYDNTTSFSDDNTPVAYAVEWNQYRAPSLLQTLLSADVRTRLSTLPFSAVTDDGKREFAAGTLVIQPRSDDGHKKAQELFKAFKELEVIGLSSGLTPQGPDLGSRTMKTLRPIKPALLVGTGSSHTEAADIRYAIDYNFGVPLTLLDLDRATRMDLSKYTHILMPHGSFDRQHGLAKALKSYVSDGGILVAQKGSAYWAQSNILPKSKKAASSDSPKNKLLSAASKVVRRAYMDYEVEQGKKRMSGAVVWTEADLTHPLLFGYNRSRIPVLYNSSKTLNEPAVSYNTPLYFTEKQDILITGYGDEKRLSKLRNSPAITLHQLGSGKVILMANNNTFRAIWLGTERLYANALFFTQTIDHRRD